MSVYVDHPRFSKPGGRKKYCHLVADSFEELHDFAAKAGIKPHFFHRSARWQHYDVAEELRPAVIEAGAIEVSSREIVALAKAMT